MKPINYQSCTWDIKEEREFRKGSGRASSRRARRQKKIITRTLKRGKPIFKSMEDLSC